MVLKRLRPRFASRPALGESAADFKPWKVCCVDLSATLPDLPASGEHGGVHLIFWWREIPLGQLDILASQLPLTKAQLLEQALSVVAPAVHALLHADEGGATPFGARRAQKPEAYANVRALAALKRPLAQITSNATPLVSETETVSVIVCTRNRPEMLRVCLQALRALQISPHEIIVVDNAPSNDATRRLVEATPGVRYVLEPRPGLSAARNAGIRASSGSLIAFTDDDVRVHPDWLRQHLQAFSDARVMATTGLVLTAELETYAQFLFHRYEGGGSWGFCARIFDEAFFARTRRYGVPVWQIGAGANMAFRREVFERVGLYDERLGAGASGCSEDSELWYRVLAQGWRIRYEPLAVVFHYHRADLAALEHQLYQYMRGHLVALFVQFERHRHWGNLYRAFSLLPRYYLRQGLRLTRGEPVHALGTKVAGYLAGFGYYLRCHRWRASLSSPHARHAARAATLKEDRADA
jgi:GT2 family glycosyltransferase